MSAGRAAPWAARASRYMATVAGDAKAARIIVSIGIAAFGAFCFVRARYPERT